MAAREARCPRQKGRGRTDFVSVSVGWLPININDSNTNYILGLYEYWNLDIKHLRPGQDYAAHTDLSRNRFFSKTLFKPEEFENTASAVQSGQKNILQMALFKNDDVTADNHEISLPELSSDTNEKKKFMPFRVKHCFQHSPASCGRGEKEGVCYSGK